MVTICMITYGHEKYIEEAIYSVLMQQTNFPIELFIVDDCSPDNTSIIVEEIIHHHPRGSSIKYLRNKSNVGMMQNFISAFNNCNNKYVALCEGDDYWTDPLKLQKQIDVLERCKEYNMCFHRSADINDGNIVRYFPKEERERDFDFVDFIPQNLCNTCSVVYRNIGVKIPEFFLDLNIGDWPLHLLHIFESKAKYLPETMANYRIHNNGSWTGRDKNEKIEHSIRMLQLMDNYFEYKFNDRFSKSIRKYRLNQANNSTRIEETMAYFKESLIGASPKEAFINFLKIAKKVKIKV